MKFAITLLVIWLISLGSSVPTEKWHPSSDGCPYYIETAANCNWYEAWEECLLKNMTLLTIDSYYKQVQIDAVIKLSYPKNVTVWLAAHDNAVDKRYVWATNGLELSYTNWALNNPLRSTNYHCIYIAATTNQWHDFPCAQKLGYICEDYQCTKVKSEEHSRHYGSNYNKALWNLDTPK